MLKRQAGSKQLPRPARKTVDGVPVAKAVSECVRGA